MPKKIKLGPGANIDPIDEDEKIYQKFMGQTGIEARSDVYIVVRSFRNRTLFRRSITALVRLETGCKLLRI